MSRFSVPISLCWLRLFLPVFLACGWPCFVSAEELVPTAVALEPSLRFEDKLSQALTLLRHRQGGELSETSILELSQSRALKVSFLEIAALILKNFPPERFDYVSLGRSGSVLSLALEALLSRQGSDAKVREFPISGLREDYFLPLWYKETLRKHFQNFFTGFRDDKKEVLVMDVVFRGGTMTAFSEILQTAQQEGWTDKDVHLLGLMDIRANEALLAFGIESALGEDFVRTRWSRLDIPRVLSPFFFYSAFDSLSHYGPWFFRDPQYEQAAQTYYSYFGETERASGVKMRKPLEPHYRLPVDNENPGFIRRTLRMGRLSDRQVLRQEMSELLSADPFWAGGQPCELVLQY